MFSFAILSTLSFGQELFAPLVATTAAPPAGTTTPAPGMGPATMAPGASTTAMSTPMTTPSPADNPFAPLPGPVCVPKGQMQVNQLWQHIQGKCQSMKQNNKDPCSEIPETCWGSIGPNGNC